VFLDAAKLFSVTLSQLMVGRLLYVAGPVLALQQGLKIAIRYGHSRRQFGPKSKPESCTFAHAGYKNFPRNRPFLTLFFAVIMDYQTHKKTLMPMLASCLVFEQARNELLKMLKPAFNDEAKRVEFHAIVSGVKAVVCEYVNQQLILIRNLCGAYGFSYVIHHATSFGLSSDSH
jgi:acyl-CoA oxidase